MSRLENVIEEVKASRLGAKRAWIYDYKVIKKRL